MEQKVSALAQANDFAKQLTAALYRGDELRRRRANIDRDIEQNEQNVIALQNLVTGVELGKQIAAEQVAADKAAAEKVAQEAAKK